MRLPEFLYVEAGSVREACETLAESDSLPLSGGTDLLVNLKHKLRRPPQVVDLKKIPGLALIRTSSDGHISVGALATLAAVECSELIMRRIPCMVAAAKSVGTPQIRNKATLGGNICLDTRCWYYNVPSFSRQTRPACSKQGGSCCHVVPNEKQGRCYSLFSADTVPALMVADAKLRLSSAEGERIIALKDLYSGDGSKPIGLARGEIATEILIPPEAARENNCYLKLRERGTLDFPILGVAANVIFEEDNVTCRKSRIVLTGVSSAPIVASDAETYLKNRPLVPETIAKAADLVRDAVVVYPFNGVPANYKRSMIKEYVSRALSQIQQESAGGEGRQ